MTDKVVINNSGINSALDVDTRVVGALPTAPIHGQQMTYNSTNNTFNTNVLVWKDLTGVFDQRTAGGGALPFTIQQYDVNGRVYEWATTDGGGTISQGYFTFHINHDYAINTDTFIHLHLSTNANITTTCAFQVWAGFAKSGEVFPELKQLADITYTFQGATDVRKHHVIEVPLSTSVATATTLANSEIEVDGIMQVYLRYQRGANGDNMANASRTFIHFCDIHHQSNIEGTLNKVAPFRT